MEILCTQKPFHEVTICCNLPLKVCLKVAIRSSLAKWRPTVRLSELEPDGCPDKATNSNEALAVFAHRAKSSRLLEPGWDMKFVTSLIAAVLLLAGVGASHAAVRIAEDHGGRIGNYVTKFQRLRSSGESVIIDGLCASACTLVLSTVPHNKICVTSRATLAFHAAYDFGVNGRTIANPEATRVLYSMYPAPVRQWIAARGGLAPQMIYLRGQELQAMYRPCP
jgi:hypothetical protein